MHHHQTAQRMTTSLEAILYTELEVKGVSKPFSVDFQCLDQEPGLAIYRLRLTAEKPAVSGPITISWQLPAIGVQGVWTPASLYEKRLRADWETADLKSRLSRHAPVLCLFGHESENRLTFACSDSLNTSFLSAPVREENRNIYCSVELFKEATEAFKNYELELWIDTRTQNFSTTLQAVGKWWSSKLGQRIAPSPTAIADPVYSTWYAYHQEMTPHDLLEECRYAKELGYGTIIVDDGWQTMDNQRGYDYTGDWAPDRFTEMAQFVKDVQALDMRCMLWYSVPFCGVKSEAYQHFKGKFLTEQHRWAPVFDPRYPEVRAHLLSKYVQAVEEWGMDGLKLDFIDDFREYPETPKGKENGRDFASVNAAVNQLLQEISVALRAIKSDVLIEFRQMYIGPSLRQLGNMFRAFDCPSDSTTNRLRTTDVRLLIDEHAVHSDMFTWHNDEPVEVAALQFNSVLFSVPQLSVKLGEQSVEQLAMIRFYTTYYNENRHILMGGQFEAYAPLANYPLLKANNETKAIYGSYGNGFVHVKEQLSQLDIINGSLGTQLILLLDKDYGTCQLCIYSCTGELVQNTTAELSSGLHRFEWPASGLLQLITSAA